jgi:hypothetical protein
MKQFLFVLIVFVFTVSCGTQRRLAKTYHGKPVTMLNENYGNPVSVIENQNDSILIYELREELQSTEISQGKLTLDPIYSPTATKVKRLYFTVSNGVITGVRSEEEYERE